MSGVDTSHMSRCVVCGEPVDMRDSGDGLVTVEQTAPDGVSEQAVREAMATALRRYESPEAHTLATAYEGGDEIVLHTTCHEETPLPEMYGPINE